MIELQYSCGTNHMSLETLQGCGITLLSHFDWTLDVAEAKRYLAKAHALGIKVLPYVSAEKAWYLDTPERLRQFNRRNPGAAVPYYQAVDPRAHPEWILIDKLGRPVPRYGSYVKNPNGEWAVKWGVWEAHGQKYQDLEHPNPWSWYMCSSAEGYIDAVERGVRAVMDMGFDGVFLDNTYTRRLALCHGHKLGKHTHRAPGRNTDKTYFELAERVHKTVKSYGADKILILNGGTQDVYAPIRDGSMIESYLHGGDRTRQWESVLDSARRFRDEIRHKRVVTALSYLGSSRHPDKDDCFYTCACALLSGFKWTAGSPRRDVVRLLFRARLIVPSGQMANKDGLWYRHYDRGMAVVNPDEKRQAEAWLPLPASVQAPVELYTGRRLPVDGGNALVRVGPASGRIVVERDDALENYLTECAVTLRTTAGRVERPADDFARRLPPLPEGDWGSAARAARRLAEDLGRVVGARRPHEHTQWRREALALLAKIDLWCAAVPTGSDKYLRHLLAAGDHARHAASLITGLDLAFEHDRPRVQAGAESELKLVLTNRGDAPYRIGPMHTRLPKGWQAVLPKAGEARSLAPGAKLDLSLRVRVPADCKLPQKRLAVTVRLECRHADGQVVPCGATCFVERAGGPGASRSR